MNARIIRMKTEGRALFWPWCAVAIAGALPAILPHSYSWLSHIADAINILGFVIGIPLLATLSLGNEFQYRTLSLWLTQPSSRMQLWGEKLSVTFVAVLSAASVFGFTTFSVSQQHHLPSEVFANELYAIVYVVMTMASATFWTLVARSTIGGLALQGAALQFTVVGAGEILALRGQNL